jgi:LacI family transcriptional regulator
MWSEKRMDMLGIDATLRAERPTVLLGFRPDDLAMELIFELADEWGWVLISLEQLDGQIPDDLTLGGALITDLPDGALAQELRERGCPAVRLGRLPHPGDDQLPVVLPDQAAAGRLAVDHLVERRFKDLAIVSYHASRFGMDHHDLWNAFCERADERGVHCHSHDQIHPDDKRRLSREDRFAVRAKRLAAWLAAIPKPVGVLTIGDDMADALCRMCMRESIRVPEEVAILGRGNQRECRLSRVQLSSIDMADLERTRKAMQLLKRLMAGEPAPTSPIMVPPSRIVERHSTDVLAVSDPMVAQALRFIWEHIETDPSVQDVANGLDMPRRTLERGFSRAMAASRLRSCVAACRYSAASCVAPMILSWNWPPEWDTDHSNPCTASSAMPWTPPPPPTAENTAGRPASSMVAS